MMKEQIFMFHYAGGNRYSYLKLAELLGKRAEVHCLELPGRGKRMAEPLIRSFQDAVDDYIDLLDIVDKEVTWFILAYIVIRY